MFVTIYYIYTPCFIYCICFYSFICFGATRFARTVLEQLGSFQLYLFTFDTSSGYARFWGARKNRFGATRFVPAISLFTFFVDGREDGKDGRDGANYVQTTSIISHRHDTQDFLSTKRTEL